MDHGSRVTVVQRLLTNVDCPRVAGLAAHHQFAVTERQDEAVAAHLGRGFLRSPVRIIHGPSSPVVVPVEAIVARPPVAGAPELGSIRIAHLGQVLRQEPHFVLAVQADAGSRSCGTMCAVGDPLSN